MKSSLLVKSLVSSLALSLSLLSVGESTGNAAVGANVSIKQIGLAAAGTIGWVEVVGTLSFVNCTTPPGGSVINGWLFDYSTPKGKAIFQALTAAQLSGKRISVIGDGACLQLARSFVPNAVLDSISQLVIE